MIAESLIAHLVGDYILQTDAMANKKTKQSLWALAHVATYMLPFLFITRSLPVLAVIVSTHFVIDRWRLARFVVALKNASTDWGNAGLYFFESDGCGAHGEWTKTGYNLSTTPPWMAVWVLIIADNTMHVVINAAALTYLH